MSFWAGLARGFKDASEKKEREKAATKEEKRYEADIARQQEWRTEDIETAQRNREEEMAFRTKEFKLRQEESAAARALAKRQEERLQSGQDFSQTVTTQQMRTQDQQWQANFDHRRERDNVGDTRWEAEQERIRADAKESRHRFQTQFEFSASEADRAAERWKKQFGFSEQRALRADEWQEAMQLYQVSRDGVSDDKWNQQFEYTQEQAAAAEARWKTDNDFKLDRALNADEQFAAEMDWRKSQATVAQEQWGKSYDLQVAAGERAETELGLKVDAISIERQNTLIALGAGKPVTGKKGDKRSTVPTAADGEAAVLKMKAELADIGGLDGMSESNQEFFKILIANPAAAAGVMSFVLDQRQNKENEFDISRLPVTIQITKVLKERGGEAYREFKEKFAAGNVDLSDAEAYIDGIAALTNYKPSKVLWSQRKPVMNLANEGKMFDTWKESVSVSANADLAGMEKGSPEYLQLWGAINDSESDNKQRAARGLQTLWSKYGRASASSLGLTANNNTKLKVFFDMDSDETEPEFSPVAAGAIEREAVTEPTAEPVDETLEAFGGPGPDVTQPTAPVEDMDIEPELIFDTPEDAKAAIDELPPEVLSQIPFVMVGGVKYENKAYQGSEEPAEVVAEPVTPADDNAVRATQMRNMQLEAKGIDPVEFDSFLAEIEDVEAFDQYEGNLDELMSLYRQFGDYNTAQEAEPEAVVAEPTPVDEEMLAGEDAAMEQALEAADPLVEEVATKRGVDEPEKMLDVIRKYRAEDIVFKNEAEATKWILKNFKDAGLTRSEKLGLAETLYKDSQE